MAIAAPVIKQEMDEWTTLGGGNSGIVADNYTNHPSGFHRAANEVPASDYSRRRDPNGDDGPYVNWSYACAGDFSHGNDARLRAMHLDVLGRLMSGQMPMICEFIGKPWADRPVYYWARWNGIKTLQLYTGSGHDHWSHISWYRSRADQRAGLWKAQGGADLMFCHKGEVNDKVLALQVRLRNLGFYGGAYDRDYGPATQDALKRACLAAYSGYSGDGDSYNPYTMFYVDKLMAQKFGGGQKGDKGDKGDPGKDGVLILPPTITIEAVVRPAE